MFINGKSVTACSGKTLASLNPATGTVLANIAEGDAQDVNNAVKAARRAFDEGPWPRMSPKERKLILQRLAALVESHALELATMDSLEAGKPIADCVNIDLPETVNALQWHAEAADKIYDRIAPTGPAVLSLIVREPIGVVGAVLPWNFPVMIAALKVGPCLAAGNTLVIKPSELTSASTIRLAELAAEAGVPEGVLNVVTGYGETVGREIGLHPEVDCITFTGSTEVGRMFLTYSAQSNLKRVLLECGGKSPMVVMDDVVDLDKVAEHAAMAAFWNMGENCTANARLLVQRGIKEALVERITDKVKDWVVGDPLDYATRLGPLVEELHMHKVIAHFADAAREGAVALCGGDRVLQERGGYFVAPTVFDKVTPGMRLSREEVFGPVLGITEFGETAEAIQLANQTDYGLAASIFSGSRKTAHEVARAIRAGTVSVNCYSEGDITTPFGGYKVSGFVGRDKSLLAHDQYCELKTIWNDLTA